MFKVPEDCGDSLEFDQEYVEALKRRAMRREMSNDLERGLEDIIAASMLESFQQDDTVLAADRILKKLGSLHAKEAMATRDPVLPTVEFAETYFSSFLEDPVVNSLEEEKKKNKKGVSGDENRTGFSKAKRALILRKYADVIPSCTEEIECDSGHKYMALILRGTFSLMMGYFTKARNDFDAVIAEEEVDLKLRVNAFIKRGIVFVQLQEPEKSMKDFRTALGLDPNNPDIFCHRGQANLQLQRIPEALEDFRACVALNDNFAIAYVQKCYCEYRYVNRHRDEKKMAGVMKEFEKGLEKFPQCIECYSLFAQVLSERREYERADALFARALELEPNNASLHVHRGVLMMEWLDDEDKARECVVDALKADDQSELAYETYGTMEIQRGNLKHAVELFDRALPLAKNEAELAHLFALKMAAQAQAKMAVRMGIKMTSERN